MKKILKLLNIDIVDKDQHGDFDELHNEIWNKVSGYTMTSKERIYGLIEGVKYISNNKVEGDIVECGVWRGGSMMAIAETLKKYNNNNKTLYLYDTYEGMTDPTQEDTDFKNESASTLLLKEKIKDPKKEESLMFCYSTLEAVQNAMATTNYDLDKIHYIKGKVEETIPATIPDKIALLRLDTDWYESTKHELEHLFPRLVKGGVLIIDDYGYWKGARKAVDEYIAANNIPILLCRMDSTGRIAIKQ